MALLQLVTRQVFSSKYNYFIRMEVPNSIQTNTKPPNILIYSGKRKDVFLRCHKLLTKLLQPNCYTIYDLESFSNSAAWIPNTRALILTHHLDEGYHILHERYSANGGPTLAFKDCLIRNNERNNTVILEQSLEFYEQNQQLLVDILQTTFKLRCSGNLQQEFEFTDGFLINQSDKNETLRSKLESVTGVSVSTNSIGISFDTATYFKHLKTQQLGRDIFYSDVLSSTQAILENCGSLKNGFVVIARYQTNGKGRSGNIWLSPKGCAMFSIQLHISLYSALGEQLSLMQHLAALAIVRAIQKHTNLSMLEIGVKWPNDIYYKKSIKIGGVLTTSSISGKDIVCNIGCGVNLDNEIPTISVNHILEQNQCPRLSLEEYFALVFTEMEDLLNLIKYGQTNEFFSLYYQNWIHKAAEVTVNDGGFPTKCKIIGIDESGYLKVCKSDQSIVCVHPDGNSFDLLNGLIIPKIAH